MDKLPIGKMAELNHVTVETLRHYDRIGLLKPAFVDKSSSYRYYDIKQSAKLDMIQYMKCLGMSLEKIREQFDKEDVKVIQSMLKEQNKWIENRILELQQMKYSVESSIKNYNRYFQAPKDGEIELQHIPERKVFCYDSKKNIYDHDLRTYEYILRELKKQAIIKHLPMIYFCNVGSILRKEMMDLEKLYSTEIFLFIDVDIKLNEGIEIIPENDYICIYCDSFYKEKEYAMKLFQYIKEKKYQIIGDYLCEVVVELPVFYKYERNMFIKLQIPVKTS